MKLYLETTIPNFLLAEDAPDKRQVTEVFLQWLRLSAHELFISDVVLREVRRTAEPRRALLQQVVSEFPAVVLPVTEEAELLTARYVGANILPSRFQNDLLHVAVAVCHRLDMIVSWNMKHLANPGKVSRINAVNRQQGWPLMRIHTPQEVLGL
jgi:predicted nucleic acid-binding protein